MRLLIIDDFAGPKRNVQNCSRGTALIAGRFSVVVSSILTQTPPPPPPFATNVAICFCLQRTRFCMAGVLSCKCRRWSIFSGVGKISVVGMTGGDSSILGLPVLMAIYCNV